MANLEKRLLAAANSSLLGELEHQRRNAEALKQNLEHTLEQRQRNVEELQGKVARLLHDTEVNSHILSRAREEIVSLKVLPNSRMIINF